MDVLPRKSRPRQPYARRAADVSKPLVIGRHGRTRVLSGGRVQKKRQYNIIVVISVPFKRILHASIVVRPL